MRSLRLCRPWLSVIVVLATVCVVSVTGSAQNQPSHAKNPKSGSCPHDDSGLKLPAGFCATVFAEGIGHARHLVVSPSGVVYVNTWSGDYYDFDKPHDGGFLVALQDKTGAGKADVIDASVRLSRREGPVASASACTGGQFTQRLTIESCAIRSPPIRSCRKMLLKQSSPSCL